MKEIQERLKQTNEFLGGVSKFLDDNFIVEGRTLLQWKKWFKIDFPDDINFSTIIKISSSIAYKFQIAANYRDKQTVQMAILEQAKLEKYHTAYQVAQDKNKKEFNKPLAAESCRNEAILAVSDLEDAIQHQKVVKDFWVKTCNTLSEMRKLLELVGYALSTDARVNRDFVIRTEK